MTDTSSIGPQWPPRPTSYARIKGIDNRGVVDTAERLDDLLAQLEGLVPQLDDPDTPIGRLSVRALIDDRLIDAQVDRLAPWAEAILPLDVSADESPRLAGTSFVYLGRNAADRASDPADLARCLRQVAAAQEHPPRLAAAMLRRVRDGGYGLRILDRRERTCDSRLLDGMAELYSRFDWGREDTREILANPESLIAVATETRDDGERVVSAGIAELSLVRFADGCELRIAELTEAATRRAHQGRGLYSGIVSLLMTELAARSRSGEIYGGALDLAFGECSGHDQGVLIAARHLGRRLSRATAAERGLPFEGYLPQHVPIAGAPRSTPYNDLFPTYLSRARLYRFVDGEQLD